MTTPPSKPTLREVLAELGGSFLRAVDRGPNGCRWCGGDKRPGFSTCYPCEHHYSRTEQPNSAAFLTYAAAGSTAGRLMRDYKAERPNPGVTAVTRLLLAHGMRHLGCAEALVGRPISHYALTPSTRHSPPHPLARMVYRPHLAGVAEVTLVHRAGSAAAGRRQIDDRFTCPQQLPAGSHVLLLEDTWVSGATALSAVRALRAAGAAAVSLLCIARWVDIPDLDQPPNNALALPALRRALSRERVFDQDRCPFTGGDCPSP